MLPSSVLPPETLEQDEAEDAASGVPSGTGEADTGASSDAPASREAGDEDLQRVLGRLEREGEQDGECRLWPASGCNDQGYAMVSIGGRGARRMQRVHKWLWERENGPVPKGWDIEHTCHTEAKRRGECAGGKTCKHRRCCELAHLEAMPHGENTANRDP